MNSVQFSARLNQVRNELNIQRKTLAESVGIPERTLADYLSGKSEPKASTISALLQCLPSVSAEWLLRGEGEMIKPIASTIQMSATDLTYYTRLLQIKQARIEELEAELARVKSIAV